MAGCKKGTAECGWKEFCGTGKQCGRYNYNKSLYGDETIHGTRHTKEHFDQILDDITTYERYCDEHKDFPNEKTVITSRRIKEIYERCLQDNDFL